MEIGLASLILEVILQAASLTTVNIKRKKQRAADSLYSIIQRVDIEKIVSEVSPAMLASFMEGPLQASDVRPALESAAFRNQIKSMFLASTYDADGNHKELIRESMSLVLSSRINPNIPTEQVDTFSAKAINALQEVCDGIISEVGSINPQALSELQQTAILKRINSLLENVEPHNAYLKRGNSPEAIVARAKWRKDYCRLIASAHGTIVPPDFESNKKIPMDELYVIPSISTRANKTSPMTDEVPFEKFVELIDRTVVLGDPGGGKSTLSNYLTWKFSIFDASVIPFHVTLREFTKRQDENSIVEYIESRIRTYYQVPAPAGYVEELLLSGEAFVVFDGLDELIDTTKRRNVTNMVEMFGIKYPLSKILVTSRRVGYDQAKLDSEIFREFIVGEFTEKDCIAYVKNWFTCQNDYDSDEADRRTKSFISQSESVPDLRSNPLMLALMCIIFRGENFIPRNRPAVYEKCSTLLFEKWDGHREIEVPLQARAYVDEAMKHVAFWMLDSENSESGVHYDKLVSEMTKYLSNRAFESQETSRKAAEEFVDFCKGRAWVFSDAGSTAEGDPLFTFTHRTFMEYFAAYHLTRVNVTPEKLARTLLPKVAKQEWEVVAQLAVQIKEKSVDKGSELVLTEMLQERRKRALRGRSNVLQFISGCLSFTNVSPQFIRKFSIACLEMYFSPDTKDGSSDTFYVFKPWYDLMDCLPEIHRKSVSQVHETILSEALSEKGTPSWERACGLILLGVSFGWEEAISGLEHGSLQAWKTLFNTLSIEHDLSLKEFCLKYPSYRPTLVISGLESPTDTISTLTDQGFSFGEIAFSKSANMPFIFEPLSFVRMIRASVFAQGTPMRADFQPLLEEICRELMKIFRAETTHRIPDVVSGSIVLPWAAPSEDLPTNILDATFILNLAMHEMLHIRFGDRAQEIFSSRIRPNSTDLYKRIREARNSGESISESELSELKISGDVLHFGLKWASSEADIFKK